MDKNLGRHISRQYNEELEDIRSRVLAMGGLVEQQIADAMTAFRTKDSELAEQVIANDLQVNTLEVQIDEECTQVLARRQPAAGDLRMIVAVIKTITDLERMGDEAEKVGKMVVQLAGDGGIREEGIVSAVGHLGDHVRQMVHDALDAFARLDVNAALAAAQEDDRVDSEYEGLLRQMVTYMMEDARTISSALNVIWTARALERIGDHSKNICEYVNYLVLGKDIRHTTHYKVEENGRD